MHWGLYSIPGRSEWIRSIERLTVEQYQSWFDAFAPRAGWADRWASMAAEAGAKYVVLTAKHHDGFCLWDSKLTDYTSMHTPARRDLIAEYAEALRRHGLRVGLYYSLVDWHHDDYGPVFGDRQHPLRHDPAQKQLDPRRQWPRYVDYLHGQVQELMTGYGTIDLLFFDFCYWDFVGEAWRASDLMRMVRKHQPGIVVNDRLGIESIKSARPEPYTGDFDHAEQNIPRNRVVNARGEPIPWESWFTLGNSWCHSVAPEPQKSARTIVRSLVNCVSKGGNLCLNVAPDAAGDFMPQTVETLRRVGRWLDVNGPSIYRCGPAALPVPEWGRYTLSDCGKHLYAHLFDQVVGHVSLEGLRGCVREPLLLATNGLGVLSDYWNPGIQTFDERPDVFLNVRTPVQCTFEYPDELDTVVRFDVVESASEQRSMIETMDRAFDRAMERLPFG
jgi:alpha-L-fucosidase